MKAQEILNLIEKNRMQYGYFGLRAMTRNPKTNEAQVAVVGDVLENSFDWSERDYVDSTDVELEGTSAIAVDVDAEIEDVEKAMTLLKGYCLSGQQIVMLASARRVYGDDPREIVMQDAIVLATWEA